ncbi:MAG TPA: hypothetical protein P5121_29540 [Caldilineaceae bacterium]|nr:hypothetical protein [Caldilineaceae bacterium]
MATAYFMQLIHTTLKEKRDTATLTAAEYEELLAITELAAIRNVPVRQLMHQLGLLPKTNE